MSRRPPRRAKSSAPPKVDYFGALGDAIRKRDPEALRTFLLAQAQRFGDASQAAEITARKPEDMAALMHQMTLARPDLAPLHGESRAWLTERGLPLPPG
jgi:hypothetical protein